MLNILKSKEPKTHQSWKQFLHGKLVYLSIYLNIHWVSSVYTVGGY